MPETAIDWDALKHEDGAVPWPAIDGAMAAIAAHPASWREVADALREDIQDENPKGYLSLYLPAVLGEAAAAMMPETAERKEIAEYLLATLMDAEVREQDMVSDAIEFGCSRLGPWLVPLLLEQLRTPAGEESFGLWGLLDLAAKSDDKDLRERVARACLAQLEAEFAAGDLSVFFGPIWTLAKLQYTPALERLQKLGRDHRELLEQSSLRADFREAIRMLKGEQTEETKNYWDRGLREFLDQEQAKWRTWYEENAEEGESEVADEDIGDGIDGDEAEKEAKGIAARFAQSAYASALSASPKKTENDVAMILSYASRFLGGGIEEWGKGDWAELLLQALPAKVSAEADWWKTVAPTTAAFLRWAASEGLSPRGETLAKEIETWGPEIENNAANPDKWGVAKSLMMQAKAEGVEPGSRQQLDEFIKRYNARLVDEGKEFEEDDDFEEAEEDEEFEEDDEWVPQQPIRRESPKVGRNDPCPCGSGKKYKKCCGK